MQVVAINNLLLNKLSIKTRKGSNYIYTLQSNISVSRNVYTVASLFAPNMTLSDKQDIKGYALITALLVRDPMRVVK